MKHFLAFAFLTSLATHSFSQTLALADEIVVTASAADETVESTPASVTIITRAEIERREARDVADVLREVPGLSVSRTGAAGKITSVFIRGGSSKQALVLWNGVEMNNAYLSAYNLGQLSSAGVERVEIVRGPYSALYGADAVSGVINILTIPDSSGVSADVEAGENGLMNGTANFSHAGDRWMAHAAVEGRRDDGFEANDDYTGDSLAGGFTFRPRPTIHIGATARISRYDLGIPRNPNSTFTEFVPTPLRREDGSESQIVVPLRVEVGALRFDLRLSESRRHDEFVDPGAPFGGEFAETDARTRSGRAMLQTSHRGGGVISAGLEVEKAEAEHVDSFGLDVDSRNRDSWSLFAEERLSMRRGRGSLELTLGARFDEFETFGSEVSPRIGVAWLASANKWRAAYGEGFRAPALGELYVPFFGNPDLGAERSRNLEVGFDRFLSASSMVSVTIFSSEFDDLIAYDGSTNRFDNIAAATSRGAELGFSGRRGAFTTAVSYTYLDAVDESDDQRLLRRPEHSGSLSIGFDASSLAGNLSIIHAGERPDVTDLVPFGRVTNEAHTTADLTFHYELGALTPYVKIENISDEVYQEVFGYPSARRRVIAGIRYALRNRS
ncbi:MAG: TonB-dependent receptor [Thermoanaerobaculia bacterium]|nr:TonB-dependent receptor [Thermoanaerobaculia bacterium]